MSELDGATWEPEMTAYPADAGEFAALWNAKTGEEREEFLGRLIQNSTAAVRCFVEGHDMAVAYQREAHARILAEQIEA